MPVRRRSTRSDINLIKRKQVADGQWCWCPLPPLNLLFILFKFILIALRVLNEDQLEQCRVHGTIPLRPIPLPRFPLPLSHANALCRLIFMLHHRHGALFQHLFTVRYNFHSLRASNFLFKHKYLVNIIKYYAVAGPLAPSRSHVDFLKGIFGNCVIPLDRCIRFVSDGVWSTISDQRCKTGRPNWASFIIINYCNGH